MQILQRLVKKGLLNAAEIPRLAEARGASNNRPLHELAVERGLVKEEDVLKTLAEEFGMENIEALLAAAYHARKRQRPQTLGVVLQAFVG